MPIAPGHWEAHVGGLLEPMGLKQAWIKYPNPILKKTKTKVRANKGNRKIRLQQMRNINKIL
jgi:hypothetical protein